MSMKVEIAAGPLYEMWKGMRLGQHVFRFAGIGSRTIVGFAIVFAEFQLDTDTLFTRCVVWEQEKAKQRRRVDETRSGNATRHGVTERHVCVTSRVDVTHTTTSLPVKQASTSDSLR